MPGASKFQEKVSLLNNDDFIRVIAWKSGKEKKPRRYENHRHVLSSRRPPQLKPKFRYIKQSTILFSSTIGFQCNF